MPQPQAWFDRLRTLVRDAAIVIAVSVALVVAIEIGLRVFYPQELSGTKIRSERFSMPDPAVGIRYVPGAEWRFRHPEYTVKYSINSRGLRDAKERSAPKPPGTVRVLLLGDSFTFGQGVDYEETWPALAELGLAKQGLGHVDLIKAGRQGIDTRSELILLHELAAQYQPDAVVVGFLINDLYTNVPYSPATTEEWDTVRAEIFRPAVELRNLHLTTLARRLLISSDAAYVRLYMHAPGRGEYLRVPLSPDAQEKLAITSDLFRQLAAACDSLGLPLAVISMPQQFQVLYRELGTQAHDIDVAYYDRSFGRLASAEGFDWVPTLDRFVTAGNARSFFHRFDGHFTAAGNAVVADVFVRDVVPKLLTRMVETRGGRAVVAGRTDSLGAGVR